MGNLNLNDLRGQASFLRGKGPNQNQKVSFEASLRDSLQESVEGSVQGSFRV